MTIYYFSQTSPRKMFLVLQKKTDRKTHLTICKKIKKIWLSKRHLHSKATKKTSLVASCNFYHNNDRCRVVATPPSFFYEKNIQETFWELNKCLFHSNLKRPSSSFFESKFKFCNLIKRRS